MQATVDPWISEWGNLALVMRSHPDVFGRRTRGSETSKYPEEEKEEFDSLSSGERKGRSLNPVACMKAATVVRRG